MLQRSCTEFSSSIKPWTVSFILEKLTQLLKILRFDQKNILLSRCWGNNEILILLFLTLKEALDWLVACYSYLIRMEYLGWFVNTTNYIDHFTVSNQWMSWALLHHSNELNAQDAEVIYTCVERIYALYVYCCLWIKPFKASRMLLISYLAQYNEIMITSGILVN